QRWQHRKLPPRKAKGTLLFTAEGWRIQGSANLPTPSIHLRAIAISPSEINVPFRNTTASTPSLPSRATRSPRRARSEPPNPPGRSTRPSNVPTASMPPWSYGQSTPTYSASAGQRLSRRTTSRRLRGREEHHSQDPCPVGPLERRCRSRPRRFRPEVRSTPPGHHPLQTETQRGEQRGFVSLLRGLCGTIRYPLVRDSKVDWDMTEQDALDILTMISLVHRKLDQACNNRTT